MIDTTPLQSKADELAAQMQLPEVTGDRNKMQAVAKGYNEAKQMLDQAERVNKLTADLARTETMLAQETDEAMISLTTEEVTSLQSQLATEEGKWQEMINPADPNDSKNIIMEIRAGTGGDESALFAGELFRMYSRYADSKGWKISSISSSRTELGGFKEVIIEIKGDKVYKQLKFESGVHRVQRVPETEKAGRVHTSTATVAVLPEAEEADIELRAQDLRIDTFMAGGNGGQSVNTTYSAVRIVHLPTNTIVTCQDEKSQQQNRLKAMQVMRTRLLAVQQEKLHRERSEARNNQIGTGDRSEKIRTYNFPQDRLTDHRIKYTAHNLPLIMDGSLDDLVAALHHAERHGINDTADVAE